MQVPRPAELGALLRDPATTAQTLTDISQDRRVTSSHEFRFLLVNHPRTPTRISRTLVQHLLWKQLADVCRSRNAHILVRREAERYLSQRQKNLALGERITFARLATRGVIPSLLKAATPEVLVALLDNPLLREDEILRLAGAPQTPPRVLAKLGVHSKWICRGPIRQRLLHNPALPVADALRIVARADSQDLHRLSNDAKVPRIVRLAAERRRESVTRSGRSEQR